MKRSNARFLAAALACLAAVGTAIASVVYSGYLANETIAANKTYAFDMNANNASYLAAQANYSAPTPSSSTFYDGTASTGSFAVVSTTTLTAANGTNSLTVVSNSLPSGAQFVINGQIFRSGLNWTVGASSAATAISIKGAVNANSWSTGVTASTSAVNVVALTCQTAGAFCNSYVLSVNTSSMTVGGANFSGGRDNAVVGIGGNNLRQGSDWNVASTSSGTAKAISNAMMASTAIKAIVSSTWSAAGVVTATTTTNGILTRYALFTSAPSAITRSGSTMTGGTDSAYTINTTVIRVPNHGLVTGWSVLYSTGSAQTIAPLVNGTTYYVGVVDANNIQIATTSARAVAGNYVTLTSSSTNTTAHAYSIVPSTITGTASFKWQGSNDCVNYVDLPVSSTTFRSPFTTGNTAWNFGRLGYQCVQLNVVAPPTGGLALKVKLNARDY